VSETLLVLRCCPEEEVARLTSAARVVLARGGWWGFKVDSVLRVAGLSTRCFYRHFETKDHLLLRMLQEDMARATRRLERVCSDPDPADRVRAWIDGVMDMAYVDRVAKPTVLFASHWHQLVAMFPDETEACRQSMLAPLRRALEDLSALDVQATVEAMFYVVCGSTAQVIASAGSPPREEMDAWVLPAVERLVGVELPPRSHDAWGISPSVSRRLYADARPSG
jgi:AcrR family transcriptional regulator